MYEHDDLVDSSYPRPADKPTPSHLAGALIPLPGMAANDNKKLDLGFGGTTESAIMKSWNELGKSMAKPNLTIIKGDKDK